MNVNPGSLACSVPLHFQIPAFLAIGLVPVALWSLNVAASEGGLTRRWIVAAWIAPVLCALPPTLEILADAFRVLGKPIWVALLISVAAMIALVAAPWIQLGVGVLMLVKVRDTRLRIHAGVPLVLVVAGVALIQRGNLLTIDGRVDALVIGLVPGGFAVLAARRLFHRRRANCSRA